LTWTGCYLGGNIGGAWANVEVSDVPTGVTASRSNSGFAGGGQIGCDYQMGAWVIGIRNMFDGTSIRETTPFSDGVFAGSFDSHVRWFDTLAGRAGWLAQPNLLLSAKPPSIKCRGFSLPGETFLQKRNFRPYQRLIRPKRRRNPGLPISAPPR
jgi:outer membrane immunogenic protein